MHKNFTRVSLMLAALAAAIALAACGGGGDSTSSSDSPEAVTKSFLTAIANGDGEQACSYASANAIKQVEQGGGTCQDQVTQAAGQVSDQDKQDVANATYEVTDQSDTAATVKVTKSNGDSNSFKLVQENGSWKIDQ